MGIYNRDDRFPPGNRFLRPLKPDEKVSLWAALCSMCTLRTQNLRLFDEFIALRHFNISFRNFARSYLATILFAVTVAAELPLARAMPQCGIGCVVIIRADASGS